MSQPLADRTEILLPMKEFADLFGRSYQGLTAKARRGWADATKIAGLWYVRVNERDVIAARNTKKQTPAA